MEKRYQTGENILQKWNKVHHKLTTLPKIVADEPKIDTVY